MVISALYKKYFQKSKIFLYPLLEIKRGTSVVPEETYLSWNNSITPEDMKLICVYHTRTDIEYINFEKNVLLKHSRLCDYVWTGDKTIFTFDFRTGNFQIIHTTSRGKKKGTKVFRTNNFIFLKEALRNSPGIFRLNRWGENKKYKNESRELLNDNEFKNLKRVQAFLNKVGIVDRSGLIE